jgi:hypothetical protein
VKIQHAVGIDAIDAQNVLQFRQVALHLDQPLHVLAVGHHDLCACVAEAISERFRPEESRKR